MRKEIEYNGEQFTSLTKACKKYGIDLRQIKKVADQLQVDSQEAFTAYLDGYRVPRKITTQQLAIANETAKKIYMLRVQLNEDGITFGKRFGVSRSTVSHWENARVKPSEENLQRMAAIAGVPISYFLE